jgi:transposase
MSIDLSTLHLDWGSSRYKGKVYRSYSLARPLWVDGKNKKKPIVKLGKLSDEQVTKWRNLLKALKDPNCFFTSFDDICVETHYAYLDVAVANAIWNELGLDTVFHNDGKRLISIATVTRILAINRCIKPASKSKAPEWFRKTALPWILDVNPSQIYSSRIFRELAIIESYKDAICKYLFTLFTQTRPASMKTLFYDLSSTNFEGTKCKLMKWGHCKSGYGNHVVLALVVNKNGLPFYWEVLPGCTADSTTMIWLLDRLKTLFKINEVTFVFDRGVVSDDNLALLESDEIKYISAMDRNQLENITGINFDPFSYLVPGKIDEQVGLLPGFKKINKNTFAREIKVDGKRRYILCFNPQLFKDQRKAREQALVNFRTFVYNLNEELLRAKKSRQKQPTYTKFKNRLKKVKLSGFVDVTLSKKNICWRDEDRTTHKIRTYQAKVVVDKKGIRLAGKLDGFWLLVTNHTEKEGRKFSVKTEDAIAPYREKEIIEEAFKDINSFVEIEPVFVWTEVHVKAHYTICVLSYLINKTLTLRLHKNKGDISKTIVSHVRFFEELSGCKLDYIEVKNIQQKNFNLTTSTLKQRDLLKRVGLNYLLNRKILDIANKYPNYAE